MKKLMTLIAALAAFGIMAGCSDSDSVLAPSADGVATNAARSASAEAAAMAAKKFDTRNSIVDVALAVNADSGEFSTLIAALVAADLVDALDSRKQFTVFAPTDAAFAALGYDADTIGDVPVDALTDILLYHVAPGRRDAEDVLDSDRIRMLNGGFTMIEVTGAGAFIDEAKIVDTDVFARNGVIHVIDAVLVPGDGAEDSRTSVVDVALAVNADTGEFSTLIAALGAAGLVETLDTGGQFTVFAPTDAAFAALGYDAANIGDLPADALTDILLYHVATGSRDADDVVGSEQIRMLNGAFADIVVDATGAYIDGAMIVQTDVFADNGVIHIIGGVMLP